MYSMQIYIFWENSTNFWNKIVYLYVGNIYKVMKLNGVIIFTLRKYKSLNYY